VNGEIVDLSRYYDAIDNEQPDMVRRRDREAERAQFTSAYKTS